MFTTSPSGVFTKRIAGVGIAALLVAVGAATATTFAGDGEGPDATPPPGQPIDIDVPAPAVGGGDNTLIQTAGSTFDETLLTKFIPGSGFDPFQGDAGLLEDDSVAEDSKGCWAPGANASGIFTELYAPVELPDGARINQLTFFGVDDSAAEDVDVSLWREEFVGELGLAGSDPTFTRSSTEVDAFTTDGADSPDSTVISGAEDLVELVGTPPGSTPNLFPHRFHTVHVELKNDAGGEHVLCGVEVEYQVAAPADPGTVFHPLDPVRAFDSRQAALPQSGRLGPNETKVIDITDGYDASGVAIPAQADAVPSTATAVAYNITIAAADGSNFVAVTAGDAASFTASAINYSAGSNVANGSSVTVASDQTIKLWGGDGAGSSHVIIDIVGFYAPPVPPNMAN